MVAPPKGPSEGARPLLTVEGATRRFGSHVVFDDLSFDVGPGERIAVTGSNGAGKTTLLRCVAGTLVPTEGRITTDGHTAGSREARRRTGALLSPERSFYARLSGYENLLFFSRIHCGTGVAREAVEKVVDELALGSIVKKRVDRCSSGMVQLLAIGRAFLGDPSLLVLDEPTKSLDGDVRGRVWDLLLRREDAALLIATHRASDVENCTRTLSL